MKFELLKYGQCPKCTKIFLPEDLEIYKDKDTKEKVVHHKSCGFKIMEVAYKMALEQGKAELAAMEAIDKIKLTPELFKMFCIRYLKLNGKWKVKDIALPQVVKNNKGDEHEQILFIAFRGKTVKQKGLKRGVNQGKRRGFTKSRRKS